MNARSSTIVERCGKISDTHAPDCPYRLNVNGLFISGPGLPCRTTISPCPSRGIRLYFSRAGLYWKVSMWLTPPHINNEMTALALGLKCVGLGKYGEFKSVDAMHAFGSSAAIN